MQIRTLLDPKEGPTAPCDAVAWSPDGKRIASGGQDRIVRIWDAATGQQLFALPGHAQTISAVTFSRDGKRLVSASGGIMRQFPALQPNPLKLPSDDPKEVADVKVWDVATGHELHSFRLPGKGPGLALSPDGETIAVTFGETGVVIYREEVFGGPKGGEVSGTLTPFGQKGILASSWGKIIRQFPVELSNPRLRDVTAVLAESGGDVVRLYNVATGKEVAVLKGHTRPPWCVAFSPDGKRIVTGGGADETIRLWDARTGQEIMIIGRHPDEVTSVTFSPDGRKIVSTSDDGDVRVWDATPVQQ
jgi:WD40 repeat protein